MLSWLLVISKSDGMNLICGSTLIFGIGSSFISSALVASDQLHSQLLRNLLLRKLPSKTVWNCHRSAYSFAVHLFDSQYSSISKLFEIQLTKQIVCLLVHQWFDFFVSLFDFFFYFFNSMYERLSLLTGLIWPFLEVLRNNTHIIYIFPETFLTFFRSVSTSLI